MNTKLSALGWLGKPALMIPGTVRYAIEHPQDWFESSPLIDAMSKTSPLRMEYILKNKDIAATVKKTTEQLCETAYSINKAYNSALITATKPAILGAKIKPIKQDYLNADAITTCGEYFLDLKAIKSANMGYQLGDILRNQKDMEKANGSWLAKLLKDTEDSLAIITGLARNRAKRLVRMLKKILGKKDNNFIPRYNSFLPFNSAQFAPSIGTPVANAIAGLDGLTTPLFSDLIYKTVTNIPPAFTTISSNTVGSIVLKNIGSSGADILRYQAANLLKAVGTPTVWNSTGMFAGAWTSLMSAAPYLIIAGVILTAAIETMRDTDVGHVFVLLAFRSFNLKAVSIGRINADKKEDRLKYFSYLKNKTIGAIEGKPLFADKLYIFSMNGDNDLKLSVEFSSQINFIPPKEAEELWKTFTTMYKWLIEEDVAIYS
ncbi:MAG TPA: hypothetical protein DEP38_15535 [Cyanobacteria bacterium UBA9226]|nr:hypothetical protein [Cyanobacteria bacterium UBA9226]